ncbi:MAG TPA: aminotransferase class V-fold PLP-dependent enzyme [Thermoanaerobaculia bacterium]|nr:aminotransferase class V-fold PLP-dependent enzyme [Thermoanaerobaculia bacterium]
MTPADTDERVRAWRLDTPGCNGPAPLIHLNNAGASLMPRPVIDAIHRHIDLEAEIGGYEAEDAVAERVAETYALVGRLIGAPAGNVALVENATVAVAQALSAFDFHAGDVLVTTHNDYTSNQLMYLALAERLGIEVRRAGDLPGGGVDPESVRRLVAHPRCRLVALTWVPTNSGLVQPAEEVGAICDEAGVPYLVDACQAVGQLPVDVTRLHCDFLAATARKFLRGPRGIGFLYVADRTLERGAYPLALDMRGGSLVDAGTFTLAPGARRFENWEYSYALVLGLGEAARYATAAGPEAGRRSQALATHLRERLAAVPGISLLDRGPRLCAIVTAQVPGFPQAADLVRRLRAAGINTSASVSGRGPFNAPGAEGISVLRISPHYYNTTEEIDAAVEAIAKEADHGSV